MYVRDRTTGAETHLTDVSNALMPSIAADGRRIVFTSRRVGEHNDILVQRLRDGRPAGRPQLLTQQQGNCSHPTFSPDGDWIAYYVILEGQRDLWIMPATGGEPNRITEDPASDIHPAWSPDGRFLAFSSDRAGTQQIYIVPIREGRAAGPEVPLATPGVLAFAPSWSPDGREIAFVGGGGEERDVWIVPSDGSHPPRRVSRGIVVQRVHWEPDQQRLLASGGQGEIRLYAMRLDGTGPEIVTPPVRFGVEASSGFFDISSDGRWLVYAHDDMEGDIWMLEARPGAL
jgi:TolB protein